MARLLLEAGVKAEDRIGVLGLNSAAHFAVLLGASRIGAVTVSVNFLHPQNLPLSWMTPVSMLFITDASIDEIVTTTLALRDQPTRLVADRDDAYQQLAEVMNRDAVPYISDSPMDERAPAVQLYTSGTTSPRVPCSAIATCCP